jgi:hypothetical protein
MFFGQKSAAVLLRTMGVMAVGLLLAGCANDFGDSLSWPDGEAKPPAEMPSDPEDAATIPIAPSASRLQQTVMDFSDRYVSAIWHVLDAYIAAEPDAARRVQAQRLKVTLATASMTIAASRDPRAGLLDMEVFVSVGKWAADRYWIPQVLGDRASGLRAAYDELERDIRSEVDLLLTPGQRADLRALIAVWRQDNPSAREVMDVRLRNLEGVVLSHFQESASARGLLANVRRLLGKVDQSLLYGERMMFYVNRTPLILSQQADLTVDRVAERFPIATVNPDFRQWASLANGLPQRIGEMLDERQEFVREVMPELRASLESFEKITTSLQGTAVSADSLAGKVRELPFEPDDYVSALDGAATSLDRLNGVLAGLNQLLDEKNSAVVEQRVVQLERLLDERTDRALNAVFQRAAALIGMSIAGLILVLITARLLFRRPRAAEKKTVEG